jgi:integrase
VTPTGLGRTYISIVLLANNFEIKWVTGQVGHADPTMTMDVHRAGSSSASSESLQRDFANIEKRFSRCRSN